MAFSKTEAFDLLRRAHSNGRLAHAYLITGPVGAGKRDLAAQLAGLVTGSPAAESFAFDLPPPAADIFKHPDVHTAGPESKSRRIVIEQVRELEKELQMRASLGGKKAGIIFEADRLQIQAANAFLKTLEEPPSHSLLILTSEHPEMLPDTILSRCISVPLHAKTGGTSPLQARLMELLRQFFQSENSGLAQGFGLIRQFTLLLQEARRQIQEENEAEFKKEEARYKQTTGSDWLDDREEYYKALTEARYLQQRFALADTLVQWWADALRHRQGYAQLDQPDYAADTAKLAARFSTPEILRRIAHLDELRENFNRNVQETLAVEAAFLKVFAR